MKNSKQLRGKEGKNQGHDNEKAEEEKNKEKKDQRRDEYGRCRKRYSMSR
jgi:hypothetical protein